MVCADPLVSSLCGPLSFDDVDVPGALKDCIADCRPEEVARISRSVNELLDQTLISFMAKVWLAVGSTLSFFFFFLPLTPQVLQAL